MFLHGFGERGDDTQLVRSIGLPKYLDSHPDFPFVVVSPQCPSDSWWTHEVDALKALLDHIINDDPVDPKRVYLTGLSMGGYGTWNLAIIYPDMFAAIAPICGGGVGALAGALKNIPVWAFHGALDDVVPLDRSQAMVNAVNSFGGHARLTTYPDLKHDSWTVTYDNPELYEWFLSQRAPSRRFSTHQSSAARPEIDMNSMIL